MVVARLAPPDRLPCASFFAGDALRDQDFTKYVTFQRLMLAQLLYRIP
jgi:hypothetical protein